MRKEVSSAHLCLLRPGSVGRGTPRCGSARSPSPCPLNAPPLATVSAPTPHVPRTELACQPLVVKRTTQLPPTNHQMRRHRLKFPRPGETCTTARLKCRGTRRQGPCSLMGPRGHLLRSDRQLSSSEVSFQALNRGPRASRGWSRAGVCGTHSTLKTVRSKNRQRSKQRLKVNPPT